MRWFSRWSLRACLNISSGATKTVIGLFFETDSRWQTPRFQLNIFFTVRLKTHLYLRWPEATAHFHFQWTTPLIFSLILSERLLRPGADSFSCRWRWGNNESQWGSHNESLPLLSQRQRRLPSFISTTIHLCRELRPSKPIQDLRHTAGDLHSCFHIKT